MYFREYSLNFSPHCIVRELNKATVAFWPDPAPRLGQSGYPPPIATGTAVARARLVENVSGPSPCTRSDRDAYARIQQASGAAARSAATRT